jgi:UrcA family protein
VDLASPEGVKMALARIEDAAGGVCGGRPDGRELDRVAMFKKCRAAAVDGAVKSLDRPLLSRLADGAPAPVVVAAR